MRVKKYQAEDMQQAVLKVKSDLGSDAIILHTRKFKKGGFFGFFAKEMVEVLATKDTKATKTTKATKETKKTKVKDKTSIEAKYDSTKEKMPQKEKVLKKVKDETNDSEVKNELKEMKSLVNDMIGEMKEDRRHFQSANNAKFQKFVNDIWSLGVTNSTATNLADKVIKAVDEQEGDDIKDILKKEFRKKLNKVEPIKVGDNAPKTIAFVGPTGVGKTTTLAKLAARFALFKDKKVGLVTADTYRIAAAKQLENYSEIMGLPLKVTYTPEELINAIDSYSGYDLIFVDTAGRSRNNQLHMSELKGFINRTPIDEIYLVLSATTKINDLVKIVDSYSEIKLDKFIITKVDETDSLGSLFEVAKRTDKPISYITTGQDVPEDIELADPEELIEKIVEGLD